MVNPRVILGTRSGNTGLWVSAPGKDANSTTYEDLLIDTDRGNLIPVFRGQISNPTLSYNASLTSVPYLIYYDPYYGGTPGQWYVIWQAGYATYTVDYTHGLGYIPTCHLVIENTDPYTAVPHIQIDSTKVRLIYRRQWTGRSGVFGDLSVPGTPSTYTFNKVLNYVLFQQPAP